MSGKLAFAALVFFSLLALGCTGAPPQRGPGKDFGPENAAVTFTIYSDFECPYCQAAEGTVTELMSEYQGQVRFSFKEYPLTEVHPYAEKAAEAAECALDQGKFWEMHDLMFANQNALDTASLKNYAQKLGMNSTQFGSCLDSGIKAAAVAADEQNGTAAGVRATPTFFVNSQKIEGGVPLAQFKAVIDQQLGKTG